MIKLENSELEAAVLDSTSCIALPIELHVNVHGECEIITYSFTEHIAREFEENYLSAPFSDSARAFLMEKLTPVMLSLGYDTDGACGRMQLEYRCDSPAKEKIISGCEIISTLDGEKWGDIPLDEFILDPSDPCDRMAVIRDGENIVCFAGVNDISEEDGLVEITVECDKEYRNRGYAASCVAKLTEYLIGAGERVKYVCSDKNTASIRTALSAGFGLHDTCLPFVCYKTEEQE